ncbi:hypothetical protein K30_010 [Salmonella phage Kenya-K30]|nr:hypothetical protein K30_010 [Salmonella phage Kenya-K30]
MKTLLAVILGLAVATPFIMEAKASYDTKRNNEWVKKHKVVCNYYGWASPECINYK